MIFEQTKVQQFDGMGELFFCILKTLPTRRVKIRQLAERKTANSPSEQKKVVSLLRKKSWIWITIDQGLLTLC